MLILHISLGDTVIIGDAVIMIGPSERSVADVKLAINAPREIKITRGDRRKNQPVGAIES